MALVPAAAVTPGADLRAAYLDLLKKCLAFYLWDAKDGSIDMDQFNEKSRLRRGLKTFRRGLRQIWHGDRFYETIRGKGVDWPVFAHTMIGMGRLNNLQFCVEDALARGVPGDLIETGAWRGGACIFMRGILKAHQVADRRVWVADSFEGLPAPDPEKYPADAGDRHHTFAPVAVALEEVKANFEKYGLLDAQVCFLKGWFKDTLPTAPIERLAVLRLDGDMYESTMEGLVNLQPKLSVGGYVIVDDYRVVPGCRKAVDDYRASQGIEDRILEIDGSGVYWQRSK
jgi:O-methyltransferase